MSEVLKNEHRNIDLTNLRVLELGIGIPFSGTSTTDYIKYKKKYLFTHDDEQWNGKPDRLSFYKELIEMDLHSISHIDALNHAAIHKVGYNSAHYEGNPEIYVNGSDEIPIIHGKAMILDLPRFLNVNYINPDEEITVDIIMQCLKYQKMNIEDYEIVLFRTGHIKFWLQGEYEEYYKKEAGLGIDAILWLASKNIKAIGADNFAIEHIPTKKNLYSTFYPGHKKLLIEKGAYIMENLNLEVLSENGLNQIYFLAVPVRFNNASAALINPVALV